MFSLPAKLLPERYSLYGNSLEFKLNKMIEKKYGHQGSHGQCGHDGHSYGGHGSHVGHDQKDAKIKS